MRRSLGPVTVVLAAALLVGCSGSGTDSSGTDSSGTDSSGAGSGVVGDAVGPELGTPDPAVGADTERQVVTTASASLTVADPAEGAQQVSELVESADGRIDQRSVQVGAGVDDEERAVADLVVRVPADALTDLLADLAELGEMDSVSVSRSDETATAIDLDARISALQTSVARLQGLLEGAATTEALLAAEAALSDRQAQVESLQSQRAFLADQVELSTLGVHLETSAAAPDDGPDGFLGGLGTGWVALVSTLGAAVVVVGVLLPWVVAVVLVAAVVLVPVRLARRRRVAVAAPTQPASPET